MSDEQIKAMPGGGLLLDLADSKADVPKSDGKKDGATELLAMLKEAEQRDHQKQDHTKQIPKFKYISIQRVLRAGLLRKTVFRRFGC